MNSSGARGLLTAVSATIVYYSLSADLVEFFSTLLDGDAVTLPVVGLLNLALITVLGYVIGFFNGQVRAPAILLVVGFLIIPFGSLCIFFLTIVGVHPYLVGHSFGWAPIEIAAFIAFPTLVYVGIRSLSKTWVGLK